MAKHFYIIGTHDKSDSTWIVTRTGTEKFAHEFIENMDQVPGLETYWVMGSDAFNNAEALEEFNKMREDPKEWERFTKKEMEYFNKAITPKIEGEFTMDKSKMANGLMLIANGFALMSQAFGATTGTVATQEETKAEAPKEEKAKRTRTAKPKDEPKIEETKTEEVVSEDDFGDFDFDGEEEKKVITVEEVRAACVSHAKKNGKEKTYEILKSFGAKSPNDLSKDKYAEVMAKLGV